MKRKEILVVLCALVLLAALFTACQPEHQHTFSEEWAFDATHHWHEAACEHSEETSGKAEHTWNGGTVTTAATCTEGGVMTYTCTVCSATKTEPIAAVGHSWDDGEVTVPVSCLLDGITTFTCTVCNATKQQTTPAQGHVWDEGKVVTPARCETDGLMTHTCSACQATKTETIAATGHVWNDGEVITPVTCFDDGAKTFTCTVCDATKQETIPATGHSYAEEWTTTTTHHWHVATCEHFDEIGDYAEHTFQNEVCTVCGDQYGSKGLEFTLSGDSTCYSVTGIGTCTDTVLYIPSTYNGLPVKEIGEFAFYENTTITGVVLPNSITTINTSAFGFCSSLTSVTIPDSVTGIGASAFSGCSGLASVTIGSGVISIGQGAFGYCSSLTSVTIPDSVTSIGNIAFHGCSNLKSVTIAQGSTVDSIAFSVFGSCQSLESVVIPSGVTQIGYMAFYRCSSLATIYYVGTQEEWSAIAIDNDNDALANATMYYYSETQPAEECYSWYYDTEGVTPVPVASHTFAEEWTTDATHHWHAATCEHTGEISGYTEHTFENGACTVCGKPYESIGLAFTISADNASYTVSGIGTCTDTEIFIPSTYNGLPVKEIGVSAFEDTAITSVFVPSSVKTIGHRSFYGCSALTNITLSQGVETISNYAFAHSGVVSLILPSSVKSVGVYAFSYCRSLKEVYYFGTATDWAAMNTTANNDALISATRYYYSETRPTQDGNYWHYDIDGKVGTSRFDI